MGLNLIRRTEDNVDPAAVALPTRDAGRVVLVGIGDAPVVLFFKLVLFSVGCGIATLPESLDELVALFVVRELHEGGFLFVGDDPAHVLVQPLAISLAQLNLERLGIGLPLFFRDRALERIYLASLGSRRVGIGALHVLVLGLGNSTKT